MEKVWEKPVGSFTKDSLMARLHTFGTELSEGFFSDGVILVEGTSDRAVLNAIANEMTRSFPESNISVIPVNGKNNIDKPWLVFNQLGIPVYPVWDSDTSKATKDSIKANRALQSMLGKNKGEVTDFPAGVFSNFACFGDSMNETLKTDFGADYQPALNSSSEKLSLSADDGKKNPYVLHEMITNLYKNKKQAHTMESIVKAAHEHIANTKNSLKEPSKTSKAA
jgi:predicted ATP-dependent endonuclease of OLD family